MAAKVRPCSTSAGSTHHGSRRTCIDSEGPSTCVGMKRARAYYSQAFQSCQRWVGLGWVGLGLVGLAWFGLDWIGSGWVGFTRSAYPVSHAADGLTAYEVRGEKRPTKVVAL